MHRREVGTWHVPNIRLVNTAPVPEAATHLGGVQGGQVGAEVRAQHAGQRVHVGRADLREQVRAVPPQEGYQGAVPAHERAQEVNALRLRSACGRLTDLNARPA